MKKINIYIGTSKNELIEDKDNLISFIESFNAKYIDKGILISQLSQDDIIDINSFIEETADATFFMFFEHADEIKKSQLDLAWQTFINSTAGKPKVFVFFKIIDDEPCQNDEIISVIDIIAHRFSHYFKKFYDIDTVKLELLQYISGKLGYGNDIAVSDGHISIGNITFDRGELDPENVFSFQNNPELRQVNSRIKVFEEKRIAAVRNNDDAALNSITQELLSLGKLRNKLMQDILLAVKQLHKELSNSETSKTRLEALSYLEKGEHKKALSLIGFDDIKRKADKCNEERKLFEIGENTEINDIIEDARTRIIALSMSIDNSERFEQMEEVFEYVFKMFVYYPNIDSNKNFLDFSLEYINFLFTEKKYVKGVEASDILQWLFDKPNSPVDILQLSRFYNDMAVIYNDSNRLKKAEKLFLKTFDIQKQLPKDNSLSVSEMATTCSNLGRLYALLMDVEKAEKYYTEAINIIEPPNTNVSDALMPLLALIYGNFAAFYANINEPEIAKKLIRKAYTISEKLVQNEPGLYEEKLISECVIFGEVYIVTGEYDKALRYLNEALTLANKMLYCNFNIYYPLLAYAEMVLGKYYALTENKEKSKEHFAHSLEIYKKLYTSNPDTYAFFIATASTEYVSALLDCLPPEEIEKVYSDTVKIIEYLSQENPIGLIRMEMILYIITASAKIDLGKPDEAGELIQKSENLIRIIKERCPNVNVFEERQYASLCLTTAAYYSSTERLEKALEKYYEALNIYETLVDRGDIRHLCEIAAIRQEIGRVLLYDELYCEAIKEFRTVLEIIEQCQSASLMQFDDLSAYCYCFLGEALFALEDRKEAKKAFLKSLSYFSALHRKTPGAFDADSTVVYYNLGNLYSESGNNEKAKEIYFEALEIFDELAEQDPEQYGQVVGDFLQLVGLLYEDEEDYESAKFYLDKAYGIYCDYYRADPEEYEYDYADICYEAAYVYLMSEEYDTALVLYQESYRIFRRLRSEMPELDEQLARGCFNIALILYENNRTNEAVSYFEESIGIYKKLYSEEPWDYAEPLKNTMEHLASVYSDIGRNQEARMLLEESKKIKFN